MDGSIWVWRINASLVIWSGEFQFPFKSTKIRSFTYGSMLQSDISQSLHNFYNKDIKIGGKIKMLNCINSWVKTMYLFTQSSFLPHLLLPNKVGHFFITFLPLSILTMKVESSARPTELVYLETIQLSYSDRYLVRFGDTTW